MTTIIISINLHLSFTYEATYSSIWLNIELSLLTYSKCLHLYNLYSQVFHEGDDQRHIFDIFTSSAYSFYEF